MCAAYRPQARPWSIDEAATMAVLVSVGAVMVVVVVRLDLKMRLMVLGNVLRGHNCCSAVLNRVVRLSLGGGPATRRWGLRLDGGCPATRWGLIRVFS
ncbi:Alkaline phosphatase [Sesbania bispinosa]|nr:Alkaline phosphatase [Sesbania bispinosa]